VPGTLLHTKLVSEGTPVAADTGDRIAGAVSGKPAGKVAARRTGEVFGTDHELLITVCRR
jgi:hypothetical protein